MLHNTYLLNLALAQAWINENRHICRSRKQCQSVCPSDKPTPPWWGQVL